uniref:Transposase n=1 Tax=Ditylenchus dipsaci TaxID=166011 RepID=A0A915DXF0_9BILA
MSAEEAVSTSSQSPSVSSSAKKRKRDSIWEKFRNLHKDGIDYVQCIECPEVIYKSTVPASTLKYHWEESKNHKSVAVITSVGDDPGAKKLTKLEQIDRAFTKVLSVPSMPINAFLHPDMRSFIDLLNRDFKLPKSHATLKSRIEQLASTTKINLRRLVSQFKTKPSITCDIWTDASMKNAYLGMVVLT